MVALPKFFAARDEAHVDVVSNWLETELAQKIFFVLPCLAYESLQYFLGRPVTEQDLVLVVA